MKTLRMGDFYTIVPMNAPAGSGNIVFFTDKEPDTHSIAICGFVCHDDKLLDRFNDPSNTIHKDACKQLIAMYNATPEEDQIGRRNIYDNRNSRK